MVKIKEDTEDRKLLIERVDYLRCLAYDVIGAYDSCGKNVERQKVVWEALGDAINELEDADI